MKCVSFQNKLEFSGSYRQGETAVDKSEETLDVGSGMNCVAVWAITPRRIILGARSLVPKHSGRKWLMNSSYEQEEHFHRAV